MKYRECHPPQVSSTMHPWAPTFAFDLQTHSNTDTLLGVPMESASSCPSVGHGSDLPISSCCNGSGSGGGRAEKGEERLTAQALLLDHPELGVSGVKVDHHRHRVEVLASAESQVRSVIRA